MRIKCVKYHLVYVCEALCTGVCFGSPGVLQFPNARNLVVILPYTTQASSMLSDAVLFCGPAPQVLEKLNSRVHSSSTTQQLIDALVQIYDNDPRFIMPYSMEVWSPLEGAVGSTQTFFYDGKNLLAPEQTSFDYISSKMNNLPVSQFLSPVSRQIQLFLPQPRLEGRRMQLFVKTLTGKTLTVEVHPNETVHHLKDCIYLQENIPHSQQRLIWSGAQLSDNDPLSRYPIVNETTIQLVLRLRGGMMHETSGRDDYCSVNTPSQSHYGLDSTTVYYKSNSGKVKTLKFYLSSDTAIGTLTERVQMETDPTFFDKMPKEQLKAIPKLTREMLSRKALVRFTDSLCSRL